MLLHLAKTESMCDSYQETLETDCQAIWTPPRTSVDNIPKESKIENVPIAGVSKSPYLGISIPRKNSQF